MREVAPYSHTYFLHASLKDQGLPLVQFYSRRFQHQGERHWAAEIELARITVNGRVVGADYILRPNDYLAHTVPDRVEPPVSDAICILKDTPDFIAVFKPAPLPVHPCGRYFKNSLEYILQEQGYRGVAPLHRLDVLTSGVVIFGKTKEFARSFKEILEKRKVQKTYYALVNGVFPASVTADFPIRRREGSLFECHPDGKPALTRFFSEGYSDGKSLVRCEPETGRTHQIRLHLNALGFPLCDDPHYKGAEPARHFITSDDRAISLLAQKYAWADEVVVSPWTEPFQAWMKSKNSSKN